MSMQQNSEPQWQAVDGPAQEEQQQLDVWGFLRRRKSIVLVLAVVGAGLAYFAFQQQSPQYRSFARLELISRASERRFDGVMGEDMMDDATFVIPSPHVLTPAYENHNLAELDTFQGMKDWEALVLMSQSLGIEQLSKGVIELQFDGSDPRDTPVITNAIADEYILRQQGSFQSESEKLKKLLATDRQDIENQLKEAEKQYADFIGGATLLSSSSDMSQPRARLSALNHQIASLDIEEADLASELKLIDEKIRLGGQREPLMLMIGKGERRDGNPPQIDERARHRRRMEETMLPLRAEAAVLKDKVGRGHPRLIAIEKRIEMIRAGFDSMEGLLVEPAQIEQETDYLAVYRQSLSHELEQLQQQRGELMEMASAAEQEAHLVQNDQQTEHRLARKIDRLQMLFDGLSRQIEQTEVNADMSGVRATVIAPAQYGRLVFPIMYQFLGIGGFLGALLGLALGYLIELADRSFRKPEEIVREFGIPILGHIPYMKENRLKSIGNADDPGMQRTVVAAHLPRSRPSEAYRSVRTAICFSAMGESHRVVHVTSPAAGDGKSTLAANLSVSLAQSGKRTILVESDFRRPNVHKIMGINNDIGIVEVLRGRAELLDAIQDTSVEELSVLPCGRLPRNPSELLTRPEYESLLELLRAKYDYVVVDSPPVLVVTDACSVAPRTDAVIVCMRLGRHTRDFGRRSLDQLRDVGANVVGIVVNGVEESDAYGYGSYNYSDYGRSYGNPADTFSYTDGSEDYFADEDEETVPVKRLISVSDEPAEETDFGYPSDTEEKQAGDR